MSPPLHLQSYFCLSLWSLLPFPSISVDNTSVLIQMYFSTLFPPSSGLFKEPYSLFPTSVPWLYKHLLFVFLFHLLKPNKKLCPSSYDLYTFYIPVILKIFNIFSWKYLSSILIVRYTFSYTKPHANWQFAVILSLYLYLTILTLRKVFFFPFSGFFYTLSDSWTTVSPQTPNCSQGAIVNSHVF